jgi:hypothetical protein
MKTALYLDDVRTPIETLEGYKPWSVVRNYEEFVQHIELNGIPDLISFDHDLADEHMADYWDKQARGIKTISYDSFKEKTGVDCLNWLIEYTLDRKEASPFTVWVHSHNPMGAENILVKASNFMRHMGWKSQVQFARPKFIIETKVED